MNCPFCEWREWRFITPDPLVTVPRGARGVDRYAYALNNPLSYVDPSGFDEVSDFINELMQQTASSGTQIDVPVPSGYDVSAPGETSMATDSWGYDEAMSMAEGSASSSTVGFQGTLGAGPATSDAAVPGGAAPLQQAQSAPQMDVLGSSAATVTHVGITFAENSEGRLIVTDQIMEGVMNGVFSQSLSAYSRYSGPGTIDEVMRGLESPFYTMGRLGVSDAFVHGGLEYSPDELNYVGVGMGAGHFHVLEPIPVPLLVEAWNLVEYGHPASFGEVFWALYAKQRCDYLQ